PAPTAPSSLSLHDALPIWPGRSPGTGFVRGRAAAPGHGARLVAPAGDALPRRALRRPGPRCYRRHRGDDPGFPRRGPDHRDDNPQPWPGTPPGGRRHLSASRPPGGAHPGRRIFHPAPQPGCGRLLEGRTTMVSYRNILLAAGLSIVLAG